MAKDVVTRATLWSIINGTADEIRDAADALARSVTPDPLRGVETAGFSSAFEDGFEKDFLDLKEETGAARRVALLRMGGRCLALLALDEAVRGSDADESEVDASEVFG